MNIINQRVLNNFLLAKYKTPNSLDCELKPDIDSGYPDTQAIAIIKEKKCVYASVGSSFRGYFLSLRECNEKCFRNNFYY